MGSRGLEWQGFDVRAVVVSGPANVSHVPVFLALYRPFPLMTGPATVLVSPQRRLGMSCHRRVSASIVRRVRIRNMTTAAEITHGVVNHHDPSTSVRLFLHLIELIGLGLSSAWKFQGWS